MKKRIRKILLNWVAHCTVVWIVINMFTVLPYILYVKANDYHRFHVNKTPVGAWEYFINGTFRFDMIIVLLFLLLVEINYAYLFTKVRWYLFAGSSLLIGIISLTILILYHRNGFTMAGDLSDIKPILLMAAYAIVYAMIRDYLYQLKYRKALQLQQTEDELNALKSQLNPHFLFNSLNYLYGTALKESAATTANGIDQLSDLLRYTITGMHTNFVSLEDEIQFINNYLWLQKARLPEKENIKINVQINAGGQGWKIAPLLLLTFIENAFKYGISMNEPSNVDICLNVIKGCLTLEVANKIIEIPNEIKSSNTGIKSTLKRLELLYPGKYTFEISNDGIVYKIFLQLQLK